jgi:thymidylate synthase ThyX
MIPGHPEEVFVSLFLEDSRVWSHEMVRHRHNMSQRSGRFVDETDRDFCLHPLLRDYLNEAGYLALNDNDGPNLWSQTNLSHGEINERTSLGNVLGSAITQSRFNYAAVVERLEPWLVKTKGLDKSTARKQARSAARYYLGNGLSTEMIFTASVRAWKHIFSRRCDPAADAAIFELMQQAREKVQAATPGFW